MLLFGGSEVDGFAEAARQFTAEAGIIIAGSPGSWG
jgi:hypothetical protein